MKNSNKSNEIQFVADFLRFKRFFSWVFLKSCWFKSIEQFARTSLCYTCYASKDLHVNGLSNSSDFRNCKEKSLIQLYRAVNCFKPDDFWLKLGRNCPKSVKNSQKIQILKEFPSQNILWGPKSRFFPKIPIKTNKKFKFWKDFTPLESPIQGFS